MAGRLQPELSSHHATAVCCAALQPEYQFHLDGGTLDTETNQNDTKPNQTNSLVARKYQADNLGHGFVLLVLSQRNNAMEQKTEALLCH